MDANGGSMAPPVVGIDLGTSNTVIAVIQDTHATVIPDRNGRRIHPSVVSFHPNAFATAFRVATSKDGQAWATVIEKEDHDGSAVDTKIAPVKTRFVRVIAVKPDGSTPNEKGGQMQVTELEVYK